MAKTDSDVLSAWKSTVDARHKMAGGAITVAATNAKKVHGLVHTLLPVFLIFR